MPKYLVVDSSVLIFYDRKGTLEDFLRAKKRENYNVIIPKAIAQEVAIEPKEFAEKLKKQPKITKSVSFTSTTGLSSSAASTFMPQYGLGQHPCSIGAAR